MKKNLPKIKLNRKNLTIVGALVIMLAIPLMVFLVGTRLELRRRTKARSGVCTEERLASASMAASGSVNTATPILPSVSGFATDKFTGAATVSYPIDLPPGPGGFAPSLSLSYSSDSVADSYNGVVDWFKQYYHQASWVGLGWNLGGLGYIVRDPGNWTDTNMHCYESGGIQQGVLDDRFFLVFPGGSTELFDQNPAFCRSGNPDEDPRARWGEQLTNVYGEENKEWGTSPNLFLKIEHDHFVGQNSGDQGRGFDTEPWIITTKDGTKYYFGNNAIVKNPDDTKNLWDGRFLSDDGDQAFATAQRTAGYIDDEEDLILNKDAVLHTDPRTGNPLPGNPLKDPSLATEYGLSWFVKNEYIKHLRLFPQRWWLRKIVDTHGNTIEIKYEARIKKIDVGDDDGAGGTWCDEDWCPDFYTHDVAPKKIIYSNGKVTVDLIREPREDYRIGFQNEHDDHLEQWNNHWDQVNFWTKWRLKKIQVKVSDQLVREYVLDYNQYAYQCNDPAGNAAMKKHSLLTSVTPYGLGGCSPNPSGQCTGQSLPPYTFEYYNRHTAPGGSCGGGTYREESFNSAVLKSASNGYGGKITFSYNWVNPRVCCDGDSDCCNSGLAEYGNFRPRVWQKTTEDGRGKSFMVQYGYSNAGDAYVKEQADVSSRISYEGYRFLGYPQVEETLYGYGGSKINANKTYYYGAIEDGDCFKPDPRAGRAKKVEVFDPNPGGVLLSTTESDFWIYDKNDAEVAATCGTVDPDGAYFVAAKETRACMEPNSGYPLGSKATYHYRPGDQSGKQWGNLTNTIQYEVTGCDFVNASPYRMTHSVYIPNTTSHITNRVAAVENFGCHTTAETASSGTVSNYNLRAPDINCPYPERLSLAWNFYDYQSDPALSPLGKGLLTSSRVGYEFPKIVQIASIGIGEFQNGSWPTVDAESIYDTYGNLTAAKSFPEYGTVTVATDANSQLWTFGSLGSGSTARTSTIGYENTYNTFPVSTTNTLGHTTATRYYDSAGVEVFHPLLAQKTVAVDVNNQQWTTIVDGLGRSKESYSPGDDINPERARAKIDYNDVNVAGEVNPFIVHTQTRDDKDDGSSATYQHAWQFYNGLGQVIESQSEKEGNGTKVILTSQKYNALGQVEVALIPYEAPNPTPGAFIEPSFNRSERTETEYDKLGRVIKSRTPQKTAGQWYETQTKYYGRKTAVLDPKNHLAISVVDNLGRTLETLIFNKQVNDLPQNGAQLPTDYYVKTHLTYDNLDRVTDTATIKPDPSKPNGQIIASSSVGYNQFGQKTSSDDPDLGLWSYTYYQTGTLKTVTDAKQQVTTFKYDNLDRMINKYYGDTSTDPVATFTYDVCQNGKGRLCHDSNSDAVNTYSYDSKGRLVSETNIVQRFSSLGYTTTFAYDAAGRQREITYPDSEHETVTYSYNDAGLLKNVANVAGAQTYLDSAEYNVLGMPTSETLGNQDNQTKNIYTYEPQTYRLASKIVKDKNGDLWSQNLGYDPLGNINEITYPLRKDLPGDLPFKINYTYDELNRLTGGQVAGLSDDAAKDVFYTKYEYDELGRMKVKQEEGKEQAPTLSWNITVKPVCQSGKVPARPLRMFRIIWPQAGTRWDCDNDDASTSDHSMTIAPKNIANSSMQGIYVGLEEPTRDGKSANCSEGVAIEPASIEPNVTVIREGNNPPTGDFVNFAKYMNPYNWMVRWDWNRLAGGDYTISFNLPEEMCKTTPTPTPTPTIIIGVRPD